MSNKKNNMAYWDEIDDIMLTAVNEVAAMSVPTVELDEDEAIRISKEAEEVIINSLKELGFNFPFVNENY